MIVRREIVEKNVVIGEDQSPAVAETVLQSQIERSGEAGEGETVLTLMEGEGRTVLTLIERKEIIMAEIG